jgi:hypothetical protein
VKRPGHNREIFTAAAKAARFCSANVVAKAMTYKAYRVAASARIALQGDSQNRRQDRFRSGLAVEAEASGLAGSAAAAEVN